MKIARIYKFESAHFLPFVPLAHKCSRLHGHNYKVMVEVSGPIQSNGFVLDFFEVDAALLPILERLDHRVLNEIIENPTAEVLVGWIKNQLPWPQTVVRVYENEDSYAEG